MNSKNILGNFTVALAAQMLNIIVSVLFSLFLPKVLGVTEFGYWQLFLFYASYTGIFHLGLNDGIYLIKGGEQRSVIDKADVFSQFRFGMLYQLAFAAIIVVVAIASSIGNERQFVLLLVAAYLLINNATTFFGLVFQAMNETKLYSANVAINAGCFLVALIPSLLVGVSSFEIYIVFYTAAKLITLLFSFWKARDFLAAEWLGLERAFHQVMESIRVGLKLMLANLTGMLVLGVARFVVDANWGIDTFSIFSFAINMVTFFMMFVSQASMVLFPALRQSSDSEIKNFFVTARDALNLFLPIVYILYFPAVLALQWWLPQYAESFLLFALLLPICVFNGKMDIVGTTYLKVLRKEGSLLLINCVTLAFSAAGAFVSAYYWGWLEATIAFAVIAFILRSLVTEYWIGKLLKQKQSLAAIGTVVVTFIFVIGVYMFPFVPAAIITCGAVIISSLCFRRRMAEVVSMSVKAVRNE